MAQDSRHRADIDALRDHLASALEAVVDRYWNYSVLVVDQEI